MLTILVSFITTFFQFFGLSTVVPLIATLSDPNILNENSFVADIYEFYDFQSYENFRDFLLYTSIIGVLLSVSLGLYNIYLVTKLSSNFGEKIEQKVFNFYLNCNYLYHVKISLPKILSNISNLIPRIKNSILSSYLNLFVQFFMVLIVSITILIVDFYFSIFAIILVGGLYLLFFKFFKKLLKVMVS